LKDNKVIEMQKERKKKFFRSFFWTVVFIFLGLFR